MMNDADVQVNMFRNFEATQGLWGPPAHLKPKRAELPVVVISGFLGAGKTTVLNRILTNKFNLKIMAAVNDYASLNIDSALVRRQKSVASRDVVELTNGCICCTLADEFESAAWQILQEELTGPDYVVVETSGLSEVSALIRSLDRQFGRMARVRLDCVIVVVDSDSIYAELTNDPTGRTIHPTLMHQLRWADTILINKIDLLPAALKPATAQPAAMADNKQSTASSPADAASNDAAAQSPALKQLHAFLAELNPAATRIECAFGDVPITRLLDVRPATDSTTARIDSGIVTHEDGIFNQLPFIVNATSTPTTSLAASILTGSSLSAPQPTAGALRKTGAASAAATAAAKLTFGGDAKADVNHVASDKFVAVTFESKLPFRLARFQELLINASGFGLPAAVIRAKGVLFFAEFPEIRYTFHCSGRRRYDLSFDTAPVLVTGTGSSAGGSQLAIGGWDETPHNSLVFIGAALNTETILSIVRAATVDPSAAASVIPKPISDSVAALFASFHSRIKSDNRFELLTPLTTEQKAGAAAVVTAPRADSVLYFRLEVATNYGLSIYELCRVFGVDLNAINAALAASVNYRNAFIAPALIARAAVPPNANKPAPTPTAAASSAAAAAAATATPTVSASAVEASTLSSYSNVVCLCIGFGASTPDGASATNSGAPLLTSAAIERLWAVIDSEASRVLTTYCGHVRRCCF